METSEHLADAIEARRKELGLTVSDLIDQTGLSSQALRNVRRGVVRQYQERLTIPVTRALHWTPDSIQRLLDGLEPEPLPDEPAHSWQPDTPDDLVAAVREAIAEGQERSAKMDAVIATSTASVNAMEQMTNQVNRELTRMAAQIGAIAEFVRRRESALARRPGELD